LRYLSLSCFLHEYLHERSKYFAIAIHVLNTNDEEEEAGDEFYRIIRFGALSKHSFRQISHFKWTAEASVFAPDAIHHSTNVIKLIH